MSTKVLTRDATVQKLRELAPILQARGIVRADLFGSVARDEAVDDSDIDLVVELSGPMGFEFFELEDFIAEKLGAPVELSTRASMRPRVLAQAEWDFVRIF